MENKIEIRYSTKNDLEQLPWLYRQSYGGETKEMTNYENMLTQYERLITNNDYKFISAVHENKLIGFCSVVINHNIVENQQPILMIWNLRVHPEYRKQGVGKSIMYFVEKFGKTINADCVFLGCDKNNTGAKKFYINLNYDECLAFVKSID